jgi:DNA primase
VYSNARGFTSASLSAFEILRDAVPIEKTVETNGHRKAHCVAHEDRNPSLHIYPDRRAHCFVCDFHGDVIDIWAAQNSIEGSYAAALSLAKAFDIQLPEMSHEQREKAEEDRQRQASHMQVARTCHESLEKFPSVREWWEGRGFTAHLRQRFLLGAMNGNEATIPMWQWGKVVGIIKRKVLGAGPKYLVPEGRKPLFIPGKMSPEIFVTEGYVDGLVLSACGRSALAIGGTNMSAAQKEDLARVRPEGSTLFILTDDDASGEEAARTWGRDFFPSAKICPRDYGGSEADDDIAGYFAQEGLEATSEHLERLIAGSCDALDVEIAAAADLTGGPREKLRYAQENIAPLLIRISDSNLRDATADLVADQVKGLKKSWINNLIESERSRRMSEYSKVLREEAKKDAERKAEEHRQEIEAAQPEIDERIARPGVLGRLRETCAKIHKVEGDQRALELGLLVALGAQLDPLPNGRPLGASILLTAPASRGKNHLLDAAVKPLPPEFYFAFEVASGQSLYYLADEDPEFLRHRFAYPNEVEGVEQLWEFLRPMLSQARAFKIVTAKDADGNMISRKIWVEGPVTLAVPTIRNRIDDQMQSRLLVAELPDYPGRVKKHSQAFSRQLLPDAATEDHAREIWLWQEGLRQLTHIRRVVFPLEHDDFALDDDQLSHGARAWGNLLSLMATAAWLEQKNRRLIQLDEDTVAVEAAPQDYEIAHEIFAKVCKRTVINLSDTHRRILDALYDLTMEFPNREGFSQREISAGRDFSQSTVSENKTFLARSAKLIREAEHGLALIPGAEPSWWAADEEDMMKGIPTPAKVRSWWEARDQHPEGSPDPPESADHADHADHPTNDRPDFHSYAGSGDQHPADQSPISESRIDNGGSGNAEGADRHDRADRHFSEDEAFPSVAAVFAEPPDWLPDQLKIYRQDPDLHFGALCAIMAALVLGDPERGEEVAEEVRRELANARKEQQA